MKSVVWSGPFSFWEMREAQKQEQEGKIDWKRAGVYIWLHPDANSQSVSSNELGVRGIEYVGRALGKPTVYERQHQHYMNTVGGMATLSGRYIEGIAHIEPPRDYRPGQNLDLLKDADAFGQLLERARQYADDCRIIAAMSDDWDRDYICKLERSLIHKLRPRLNRRAQSDPLEGQQLPVELPRSDWWKLKSPLELKDLDGLEC